MKCSVSLPSLATFTHRRHQPHVSLTGGADMPAHEVLAAIGHVPARPVRLQVDAGGCVPRCRVVPRLHSPTIDCSMSSAALVMPSSPCLQAFRRIYNPTPDEVEVIWVAGVGV